MWIDAAAMVSAALMGAAQLPAAPGQSPVVPGQTPAASGQALAADAQPVVAPVPSWVKPVALPTDAPGAKADAAPIRMLYDDEQDRLDRDGQTRYAAFALRIDAPQGLSAGNLSFTWRPDDQALYVHRLAIRRGAQTIDVLKSGQRFTVVRREQNLEAATLDGQLTANIQPEGLQVGDILEVAISIRSSDPTLKGHVEQMAAAWNGLPIDHAHLRVEWPDPVHVRMRSSKTLDLPKPSRQEGLTTIEIARDAVTPIPPPKDAPARYLLTRYAEFSDFADWSDLSALMAPLYAKAETLPATGPLHDELARIMAASTDPKARAGAALSLVEDRIRYVALALGTQNLVPAAATTTWERRYGDCKAKTVMLLGLLHAMGIEAQPVLVNSALGDAVAEHLPMVALFDHVIVRATIAGETYWLDGTRVGDVSVERLQVPDLGWGLVVAQHGGALVRIVPPPFERPTSERSVRIDARAGVSLAAPFHAEQLFRGDAGLGMKLVVDRLVGEARDRSLREFWRREYDFVDISAVDSRFDAATGEERLTMDGSAKLDWRENGYETDGTAIGYKADFKREPGPFADVPVAMAYPYYTLNRETILLPATFGAVDRPARDDVDQTVAGVHYLRRSSVKDGVFTIEKSERALVPEISMKDALAAQPTLRDWAENAVYLRKPAAYRPTEKEVAAQLSTTPSTASGYVDRGNLLLDRSDYDAAIADFDKALALQPQNGWALADRGMAHIWKGETAKAEADLTAAEAIDPANFVAAHGRGVLAEQRGDEAAAVTAFGKAIASRPQDGFALEHRAGAYHMLGDDDAALRDADAALALNPHALEPRLLRVNVERSRGHLDSVPALIAAMEAATPDQSYAHVAAGNAYAAIGRRAEADAAYDRALAIKPEAYIYLNRGDNRPQDDLAGRRADAQAALKLEPDMPAAIELLATTTIEAGDAAGAVGLYDRLVRAAPDDPDPLDMRGIAKSLASDDAGARQDFTAAEALAKTPVALNNLCWRKALRGVAPEMALKECEAALAHAPANAGYLDSKALALLRLGRIDEAIATYDRVLVQAPSLPSSLLGRAIAHARKGDVAAAEADRIAAARTDPAIEARFARYGLKVARTGP